MLPRRHALAFVAFALFLVFASGAHANGRFPRAQRLVERGGDPEKLVLAATYGILLSDDRGAEWRHVCELGFAFANAELDPIVAAFPDDSLLVRGIRSLNRAHAPYCDFAPVLGGEGTESAADFSLDAANPNRVLGLVMERGEGGGTVNRLYESLDGGRSFAPFGAPLPEATVTFGITLDIAPSDASRLYATALGLDGGSVFARSDDDGELWTTSALELGPEEYPYIAAVDATNADAIYVRTDSAASVDGIYEANDALLYSDDGGASFRELLRMPAKLLGFALSPDGRDVLAGYGDPMDPGRFVDRSVLGIYRASTSDFEFSKIFEGSVSCLAWTETGLYVCTPQDERGFALGFAPNAEFELGVEAPFVPLLDLRSVRELDCPSCSGAGACRESWPTTCALFGSCDAGVGGSASSDADCAGAGGTSSTTRGGAGGAMSGGAPAKPSASAGDEGCGCRAAFRGANASALITAWSLVLLFCRRVLRRDSTRYARQRACIEAAGRL